MKTATGTWDKELTDAVLDGYEFTIYTPLWLAPRIMLFTGKCEEVLPSVLLPNSLDSIVTDPPYELGFMGKEWDSSGIAFSREMWAECFRVLKPGGHLLSFGGTRTWHRMAVAIEDAGFEIRDSIAWMHGQGFPKSQNVSKALGDKRCQCEAVESTHDGDVRGVRDGVPATTEPRRPGEVTDLLAPVQREGARPGVGEVRGGSAEDARPLRPEDGRGEPRMEGRRDVQAAEGELCGSALRALPTGVPADGPDGRLHHGAPPRDGAEAAAVSAAVGSGEPHQPRPAGQPAGEPGALPVERGSQAWGGWPLCGRCGKPSIPDGLGTAAKPAFEPVVVARKPLIGTVAANVLEHGTGALNIDACRIATDERIPNHHGTNGAAGLTFGARAEYVPGSASPENTHGKGRWPANVILSEDQATELGEAARFFYCAKAPTSERPKVDGQAHATVKPLTLMRWLVQLVTPPGGIVGDPFAGSGTTLEAAYLEGFSAVGVELEDIHIPLIRQRLEKAQAAKLKEVIP